ncbi:MAG: bifunctional oligoribonuclease/PAP phosphatase NrnA [Ruminococcaceae bacterium]|nr:bifunctional oligoribonuclease/PAP phosphatase NrnA [Oscillospiraceae bacterium]
MRIDEDRVIELFKTKDNILILTHENPDGDTLGCGVALCHVLISMGKKARVENSDEIPSLYAYLFENLEKMDFKEEFIVAVDIADTKLLGERLENLYADKIDLCIDHHSSNMGYAKELLLREKDGAAALTLYRVLKKMGATITKEIATALYTGLSTDTGCFRYANANAEAYRVGADLIEYGANNAEINIKMFETKPIEYFKLITEVLKGMRMFLDNKVVVLKVTQEMLDKTGALSEYYDAIATLSRQVEGTLCGITMKENSEGGYKFSLRTHDSIDAAALCSAFGGGGHIRAAGCEIEGDEEEALLKMLKLIEEQL